MKYYLEPKDKVVQYFQSNVDKGLTSKQVEESRRKNGANILKKEKPVSLGRRIWDAAKEPMIIMLILAGFITLGVNVSRAVTGGEADYLECVGIFAAISLSVVITVIMEGRSAKAFEELSKITDDTMVKVIRNGEAALVCQKDIVAGDIICLSTGDRIPADGRLLENNSLHVDESALTGESLPAEKDESVILKDEKTPVAERVNMVYSGCFITSGTGKMAVTGVGGETEFGKIAAELSAEDKTSTPLQEKLAALGKKITILGAAAAAVVFLLQVFLFTLHGTATWETISEAFITSIVLIVAAVPEGLPTIVAVSLSINIIKMSKQNALVKKMIACETVGCINVICSDKTGTLTENRMTVTKVCQGRDMVYPDQVKDVHLIRNFCLNSTADIRCGEGENHFIGNPTECALLVAANKVIGNYRDIRNSFRIAHVFPFSSETKNMTTIQEDAGGYHIYSKGSPEKILEMCALTKWEKEKAQEMMFEYESKAFRVIAFAHREYTEQVTDFEQEREKLEDGLHFDGFCAITDPLRKDVCTAVDKCRKAGIDVKMLTGDNIITASAIAKELQLLDDDHIAVEAKVLESMSEEQLAETLPKIRVIARSTPTVKMRVVKALKSRGDVVAVTGDGINDAPAIKNADVGIAMGISGTEVSKEASDIVLLDDSFSTIVKAVQWGRGIYENFQRFIQFQLTVNLSSVIVVLASIIAGFAAPFSALQLLWINIIMDGPPALTLGLEPIRGDLMKQQPTRRNTSIVSKSMLSRIVINGLYISIVFMAQHWFNFMGGAEKELPTILFTLFVVFQLFNAFNSRELSDTSIFCNLASNRLMLGVFALTFALQVIITQFGGAFFGTVPLSFLMWCKIIVAAFSVILVSEIAKLIKRVILNRR